MAVPLTTNKEIFTEYDPKDKCCCKLATMNNMNNTDTWSQTEERCPTCKKLIKPYSLNILMEFAGKDLSKVIALKPLTFLEFVHVMRDCIQGMVYMHMKKLVHRDLKP